MNNAAIAKVFQDIADLLELKGEIPFKVRAYQRASRAIEHLSQEAEVLVSEGRLRQVPGVGESIAQKIEELLTTGRLAYYEELRAQFPSGITTLMDVPGVGPKTAARLSSELGIGSVEELEAAILEGKVASLFRLGDKTAENILRSLRALRRKDTRTPLGQALPVVEEILAALRERLDLRNLTPAGSLRRLAETVGDIDIIATSPEPEVVTQTFVRLPQVREVLVQGPQKASILVPSGLQVDLRIVDHDCFGSLLQHFTGSKDHNVVMRERAIKHGLKISEYGVTVLATGETERFVREDAFYERLGLQFIPPELREGRGEVELAERGEIPRLVELGDIKGDLHTHTDWSDGHNSIEEMALAAKERGYQYLCISDHSAGRGIARGLTVERLREQMAQIRALNERLGDFRLLCGAEVDIRADGSLDFPDEVLAELDVVTASVHSSLTQDEARMTQRMISAMRNPNVDIIGHPTGRILGQRDPVQVDLEAIFRAALETHTALEINAIPNRLDLKDDYVRHARELGVALVIDTDAHAIEHLGFMRFGVGVARRGWCEAKHILNTRPWDEIEAFFSRN